MPEVDRGNLPMGRDAGFPEVGGGRGELLMSVGGLVHHYPGGRFGGRGRAPPVQALRGVSLELFKGECLAIVGESGSGKSTLARAILRLVQPTAGEVLFRGRNVMQMGAKELLEFRRKVQIVFQDPFGSLNPRLRAGAMLDEVLTVHGGPSTSAGREKRVIELLQLVGLSARHCVRYPHEFSGGQRQRLGIARALSVGPELLVLDEPVSALDLSVRAQVLNLLKDLQEHLSLTMLLVAHDLSVVRQVANRIALIYAGKVVESAPVEDLFRNPIHPYTRGLMAAADPEESLPGGSGLWKVLPGEAPSATRPPDGCAFHPRCPHPGKDDGCVLGSPDLTDRGMSRRVACWKER